MRSAHKEQSKVTLVTHILDLVLYLELDHGFQFLTFFMKDFSSGINPPVWQIPAFGVPAYTHVEH